MNRSTIQLVWFKRDLRLRDHAPLRQAIQEGIPTLLVYFMEPSIRIQSDWDVRHERFIYESLRAIQLELEPLGLSLEIWEEEVLVGLQKLVNQYIVKAIFSHEETGTQFTYARDKLIKSYCKTNGILWKEFPSGGVIRGLKNRSGWKDLRSFTMNSALIKCDLNGLTPLNGFNRDALSLRRYTPEPLVLMDHQEFQKGGEGLAWKYLQTFLEGRIVNYSRFISKPVESRMSCSRLSPYLAWGNLSVRQVYQFTLSYKAIKGNSRNIQNFLSRLSWRCHFIQKLETETRIESENINRAFNSIRTDWNEEYFQAWKEGKTGYPLIDACMLAVSATGYLNFRMRALLVSFLTHHLWLDWRPGALYLARMFLDYEPGIHFSQFQMQAGTMGVNTIRIYNPTKQAMEQDPEGKFIRKWIPALKDIPLQFLFEPWKLSNIEQEMYHCRMGLDYPYPIVDIEKTGAYARVKLWSLKKTPEAKMENEKILGRLTNRIEEEESNVP